MLSRRDTGLEDTVAIHHCTTTFLYLSFITPFNGDSTYTLLRLLNLQGSVSAHTEISEMSIHEWPFFIVFRATNQNVDEDRSTRAFSPRGKVASQQRTPQFKMIMLIGSVIAKVNYKINHLTYRNKKAPRIKYCSYACLFCYSICAFTSFQVCSLDI